MMAKLLAASVFIAAFSAPVVAVEYLEHDKMLMDHGDGHLMDMAGGMVMGQNTSTLPGGCDSIAETREVTVHAGHKYAEKFPGRMYTFDTQEFNFKPCTKLTVHFVNDDNIRHQWMMHGLPKYLYPKGMFHLEVSGPGKISGTLILPPGDKTYLVHCDIAQHMEKGMKAQLKVGKGEGDLSSIPGITAYVNMDDYNIKLPELITAAAKIAAEPVVEPVATAAKTTLPTPIDEPFFSGVTIIGLALGLIAAPLLAKKFKGMSMSEIVATVFEMLGSAIAWVFGLLSSLISAISGNKNKVLPEK